jgi:molybdenum cofactor cytidylyltransferase
MTGLIILAAGSSSRLGKPKQTLILNGKSLLQHAIDEGLSSACDAVLVVLGANELEILASLASPKVVICKNPNWKQGLSTSIRCGIDELTKSFPDIKQAIIMPCDQPFVDAKLLNQLLSEKEASAKDIVACSYDGTYGTPAIFDKHVFSELQSLTGDQGAKKIILASKDRVSVIPFALANIDIDTEEDYRRVLAANS